MMNFGALSNHSLNNNMTTTPTFNSSDNTPTMPDTNKYMLQFIYLHATDFRKGPILIHKPGKYILQVSVQDIDWSDQQSTHDYLEAIMIKCNNVEIDLNGNTLSFSETMLALNPEIALIRVDPKLSHVYIKISNGTLGRTAYGVAISNTQNARIMNVNFRSFSRSAATLPGCRTPLFDNCTFSSHDHVIKTSPLYECYVRNVLLGEIVLGYFQETMGGEHKHIKELESFVTNARNTLSMGCQEGSETFDLFVSDNDCSYDECAAIVIGVTKMRPASTTGKFSKVRIENFLNRRKEWKGISVNGSLPLRDALGYLIPWESVSNNSETVHKTLADLQLSLVACLIGLPSPSTKPWVETDELTEVNDLDFRGLPLYGAPLIELTKADALHSNDLEINNIDFSGSDTRQQWIIGIENTTGITFEKLQIKSLKCNKDIDIIHINDDVHKLNVPGAKIEDVISKDASISVVSIDTIYSSSLRFDDLSWTSFKSPYVIQPIHHNNNNGHPISFHINTSDSETVEQKTNDTTKEKPPGITFPPVVRPHNLLGTFNSRH
jgi:hypothetical protein